MSSITKDYWFTKHLADNLKKRYESKIRADDEPIHVSDLAPTAYSCFRKSYYDRKFPQENRISNESVHAFIRGESSEYVITELAKIGAAQVTIKSDGIVARPDILKNGPDIIPSDFLVIELKDNATLGKRLEPNDPTFKGYLNQLLYYLVLTDIESGILCIKYSVPELIWYERNNDGDHYIKPLNGKGPGLESWSVVLSINDPLREEIKQEMFSRRDIFLEALTTNNVSILPRLIGLEKRIKCKRCAFFEKCWVTDEEMIEAKHMFVVPIHFAKKGKEMLAHAKRFLEERGGSVAIHPRFQKLLIALRTATENGEGKLDKDATSHDHVFDAFSLSLMFWH
jgi:hypothetical protein